MKLLTKTMAVTSIGFTLALAKPSVVEAKSLLFSLATEPEAAPAAVTTGAIITTPVQVNRTGAGVLKVYLTASNLPNGVTATFSPNPVVFTGNSPGTLSATVTISAPPWTPAGSYAFLINGKELITGDTDFVSGMFTVTGNAAPMPRPELKISQRHALTTGTAKLTWTAPPGQQFVVQATTDLSNPQWTNISTNAATADGTYTFVDQDAKKHASRFYRLISQ